MQMRLKGLSALLLALSGAAGAAEFCVGDAAGLSLALDIADNNGVSDTILLQQGVYDGNFNYNANATESGDLLIAGGYAPGCASRTADAANTILRGAGGRTLTLSGRDNSNLEVDAVTLRDGRAAAGGAGMDVGRWLQVIVRRSAFIANQTVAGGDGSGGLNIDRSGSVEVIANRFVGNDGGKGGGLSLSDPVIARIDSNLVLNNHAMQNGGGIDADSAGRFVFTNNVVARNSAVEDAGGIGLKLFDGGSADLTNNTVTLNSAGEEAGGIEFKMIGDSSAAALYNNIVHGNTATLLGRDLFIDNDDEENGIASPVTLLNNDFDASFLGLFFEIPVAVDPSNLDNVNPAFVDPASDDFRLGASSLLIDAGTVAAPELPTSDFTGGARVEGPAPDLGAYERAAPRPDTDGDGVDDDTDNCTLVQNPLQIDTNGDGFGNACDADLNNDGMINFSDLAMIRSAFFATPVSAGWNPDADFNNDDAINFADLGLMSDSFFGTPGPSGIAP